MFLQRKSWKLLKENAKSPISRKNCLNYLAVDSFESQLRSIRVVFNLEFVLSLKNTAPPEANSNPSQTSKFEVQERFWWFKRLYIKICIFKESVVYIGFILGSSDSLGLSWVHRKMNENIALHYKLLWSIYCTLHIHNLEFTLFFYILTDMFIVGVYQTEKFCKTFNFFFSFKIENVMIKVTCSLKRLVTCATSSKTTFEVAAQSPCQIFYWSLTLILPSLLNMWSEGDCVSLAIPAKIIDLFTTVFW